MYMILKPPAHLEGLAEGVEKEASFDEAPANKAVSGAGGLLDGRHRVYILKPRAHLEGLPEGVKEKEVGGRGPPQVPRLARFHAPFRRLRV